VLRFFFAMILFARRARYSPAPTWTIEDAASLAKFLQSPCGLKLKMHLAAQIAAQNEEAARVGDAKACGWACGYKALWAMFQTLSLSHVRELPDDTEDARTGAGADLEHFAP
jgi:hypothetical protein